VALDAGYNALSFFSECGFRYFLPAYLIVDLDERLQTADRDEDVHRLNADETDAALDSFWRDRAMIGPAQHEVRQHLKEEAEYLRDIGG
jgi:hypothetical protein